MLTSEEPPKGEDVGETGPRANVLAEEWQTAVGQIWQMGAHRLVIGDCTDPDVLDVLLEGRQPKYGIHDPPYGIDVVSATDSGGAKGFGKIGFTGVVPVNQYAPVVGDNEPFDPAHLLGASEHTILWGANYYADKLPPMKGWLVWDKKGREDWRDNFSDCELAWSNLKTVTRIYRHTWMGMVQEGQRETRYHPTQKPALLYEKIIEDLCEEEGLVVDFYAGSGPTVIACERLGRPCAVTEITREYAAVILHRWATLTGKRPVLREGPIC